MVNGSSREDYGLFLMFHVKHSILTLYILRSQIAREYRSCHRLPYPTLAHHQWVSEWADSSLMATLLHPAVVGVSILIISDLEITSLILQLGRLRITLSKEEQAIDPPEWFWIGRSIALHQVPVPRFRPGDLIYTQDTALLGKPVPGI